MLTRILAPIAIVPLVLVAGQVTLTNGDRITGTIVAADEKAVTLKTEAMGEVKIDRGAVAAIASDEPLTVTLKSGEKVAGAVATEQGQLRVIKPDKSVVTIAPGDWQALRNAGAQKAWEREQMRAAHPPLDDFWSGDISLNLATASGNARTTTLGIGGNAQRVTGFDKMALAYSQIYSKQSTTAPFGPTANRVSGGFRYDRNLTTRLFGFGLTSFDYDRFQNLDLRSVIGGGLGFHVYKRDKSYFDVATGGVWNREAFSTGLTRNSGEVVISEDSSHQLSTLVLLFQRLSVFPNLSRTGQYRVNFDGGASLKLTRLLSWNVNLSDRYLSNPLPGNHKNDVILTTGIGLRFEQR